ncbi:MAG: type II toxin-antitoxin system PemK/MazF family toxin [Gemmatimonadetes bacterium]|nr:type II toxin-antitoxin system PemK/MazF family toxin [Gemmatimonadota bacterium]
MTDGTPVRRGDVVVAVFANAQGGEIRKRRPFVVISPDELNEVADTYVAAGLTTGHHPYRYRVPCKFASRKGHVVLDQLYTLDASRIGPPIGRLAPREVVETLAILREMFAE